MMEARKSTMAEREEDGGWTADGNKIIITLVWCVSQLNCKSEENKGVGTFAYVH